MYVFHEILLATELINHKKRVEGGRKKIVFGLTADEKGGKPRFQKYV